MSDQDKKVEAISKIQADHTDALMKMKNVVGIAIGRKQKEGSSTEELSLVVLVDKKIPKDELTEDELIPDEIDGIPTDVQETGGLFFGG